ncbi:MAG: AraC family transcriptional regulator ligand-binding domain-containing protein [Pseudomonadota bacterium]
MRGRLSLAPTQPSFGKGQVTSLFAHKVVGDAMLPDEYGALGLAWKAAATLLGSSSRVARYARLWTSFTHHEVEEMDDGVLFTEHCAGARRLGLRIWIEADLASGVSLSRQVSSPSFTPLTV